MSDSQGEQPVKLTRGARKRAQTRADLLAAARKVFETRGIQEASIAEITEEADLGIGTFYLHFRDKEAVFQTLIDEGLERIRQQVIEEIHQSGGLSLPVFIRAIFRYSYGERDLLRLALIGRSFASSSFSRQEMITETLLRALERGQAQEAFNEEELQLLAHFMMGIIEK